MRAQCDKKQHLKTPHTHTHAHTHHTHTDDETEEGGPTHNNGARSQEYQCCFPKLRAPRTKIVDQNQLLILNTPDLLLRLIDLLKVCV